jgi:hypothetical protein
MKRLHGADKDLTGPFTAMESKQLARLHAVHGNNWSKISEEMGRSMQSVRDHVRYSTPKPAGEWTREEDAALTKAVYTVTKKKAGTNIDQGVPWQTVVATIKKSSTSTVFGRTEHQCSRRWYVVLNWKQRDPKLFKKWKIQNSIELVQHVYNSGVVDESEIDWSVVARTLKGSAHSNEHVRKKCTMPVFRTGFGTRGCHCIPRMFASSEHACDQWHSSREVHCSYRYHHKLCRNAEGLCMKKKVPEYRSKTFDQIVDLMLKDLRSDEVVDSEEEEEEGEEAKA